MYEIGAHCHHALLRYFFWFSSFLISTESSKYFKKLSSSRKSTIDVYFFLAMRRVSIASTSLACFMISLYLYKLVWTLYFYSYTSIISFISFSFPNRDLFSLAFAALHIAPTFSLIFCANLQMAKYSGELFISWTAIISLVSLPN